MLKSIVGRPGVTAQVGPLIPDGGRPVYERTRRMAMTAQDPMPKNVAPVSAALERLAQYVKEYADA
jgi:hypothetical protein